jgi:hypothetical protein
VTICLFVWRQWAYKTGQPKSRYEISSCWLSYALLYAKKCYNYQQLWCGEFSTVSYASHYLINTHKMFVLKFQICILITFWQNRTINTNVQQWTWPKVSSNRLSFSQLFLRPAFSTIIKLVQTCYVHFSEHFTNFRWDLSTLLTNERVEFHDIPTRWGSVRLKSQMMLAKCDNSDIQSPFPLMYSKVFCILQQNKSKFKFTEAT